MLRSFRGIEGASGGIKWLFETENNMCDVRSPGKRRAQKQSNRCELYIFCLSYYFRRHQVRTSGDTRTHFPKRPGHQKASGSIRWLQHQVLRLKTICATPKPWKAARLQSNRIAPMCTFFVDHIMFEGIR